MDQTDSSGEITHSFTDVQLFQKTGQGRVSEAVNAINQPLEIGLMLDGEVQLDESLWVFGVME